MYKKIFVLLFFAGTGIHLMAQVTMSLQVAPAGVVQKAQLWNMVLVNTSDKPVTVYASLNLLSARDNRSIMTATTRAITLSKGAKQLNSTDISPVRYNYLSSVFNIDRSPDGFLPIGNYKACYTIYKAENDYVEPLAEDCIPVEVQPLGPPLLNTPADNDTIATPYPQFTWLPAVPLNLFSNLNYDLLLVEVLPGQSKGDAIQKNLPVYNVRDCKTPFNNYPASGKSLDTGRVYAWKVIAKNEDEMVAQTEIWTFKVNGNNKIKPAIDYSNYILLQDDLQGMANVKDGRLYIKYYSFDRTRTAPILFTDETGKLINEDKRQIVQGDNYLDFTLNNKFQTGHVYRAIISGADGKKHVLRFNISKNQ